MCYGFGTIVTKAGDIFFTVPDLNNNIHHSSIINLAKDRVKDNLHPYLRSFVRTQNPRWTEESFHFDEYNTLPAWAENDKQLIKDRVNKLMKKYGEELKEYVKAASLLSKEFFLAKREITQKYDKTLLEYCSPNNEEWGKLHVMYIIEKDLDVKRKLNNKMIILDNDKAKFRSTQRLLEKKELAQAKNDYTRKLLKLNKKTKKKIKDPGFLVRTE